MSDDAELVAIDPDQALAVGSIAAGNGQSVAVESGQILPFVGLQVEGKFRDDEVRLFLLMDLKMADQLERALRRLREERGPGA
jgi:hypothetical protein